MNATRPSSFLAVYDFSVAPYNFDFFPFPVAARAEWLTKGLESIRLLLIALDNPGGAIKPDEKVWRLHNLIMPGLALLASVGGLTLCTDRNDARELALR